MERVKVHIDQEKCIGSGQCVLTEPGVFDQRETDGIVCLITELPDQKRIELVRKAERLCPSAAIRTEVIRD